MKNNLKRVLSWVLTIAMVISYVPTTAFAEVVDVVDENKSNIEETVAENVTEEPGDAESELVEVIVEDTTTSTSPSPSSFNNEDSIPQIKPSPTKIHKVESYSSLITRCDTPNRYKLTYEDKVFIYDPCLIENTQIPSDIHLLHKSLHL